MVDVGNPQNIGEGDSRRLRQANEAPTRRSKPIKEFRRDVERKYYDVEIAWAT